MNKAARYAVCLVASLMLTSAVAPFSGTGVFYRKRNGKSSCIRCGKFGKSA